MAVFRVEKTQNYTVMSNHHLRNKDLTLKAKGLLSQILSLPESWDYTLQGLSVINREKIDAIREAVKELERAGYITRMRERNNKGQLLGAVYIIRELPQQSEDVSPISDLPILENPMLDNPTQENPTLENPTQLSKEELNTELSKKDVVSTHSIPIHSLHPLPCDAENLTEPEVNGTESAFEIYRDIIKDNIEYDRIVDHFNEDSLDEILDLILETVCTKRKIIRIAGDDYPAEVVKSKFLKLSGSHIEFVFNCMKENTSKIRNIKKYLLAVLFNAPSTIDNYYSALVNHDMAHWGE